MPHRRKFFGPAGGGPCLWCLLALLLLLTGCASAPLKQARTDFYGGRLAQAEENLSDPSDVSKRDQLLFYLEKGLILHHAGKYDESLTTLLQASALIEQQDIISASEQTGSMVTSERIVEYKGEYAERLLVHTYLMMGFLLTNKPESALVEARQALEIFDAFPEATDRDYFTRALIAHCFEINGEINGAYIEYKKLAEQMNDPAPVADKLASIAARLGFFDDMETWQEYIDDPDATANKDAELILFVSQGQGPVKIPRNIILPPSIRFSFATYRERTRHFSEPNVTLTSQSGPVKKVTSDVNAVLKDSLNARLTRILAKETIRAGAKETIAQQIDDPLAQALIRVAFFIMEEPDTRGWETLPAYMTLIRIPVSPGEHEVTVHVSGSNVHIPSIHVSPPRRFYHYSIRSGFEPPKNRPAAFSSRID